MSATNPAGGTTSYGYDADSNLTSVTDLEGHTQTGTYNSLDELTSWTNALGKTTSYEYDGLGDLTSVTDPKGQKTIYAYGGLNQLSEVAFGSVEGGSPSSTIKYGYDAAGDLISVADSRGGTYTLGYDAYHRLTSETGPNGSVGYSYDADGERTGMTVGGEEAASYSYSPDGQLTAVDTPNGNVSLDYDEDGQRTKVQLPDSDTENYAYNGAGELAGITYKNPAGEELGNLDYARDALGRISTISGSYARTNLPEALSEASYNAGNELTSLEGKAFSYDADGNLTSNGTSTFEWNDRNQLTGVTQGSEKWSYAYDPFGRRTSKTANGVETKYLYEGENVARESNEGKTAQLINGLRLDERFARTTSAGTDSYLTDALGSTLALAGESGEPITEYTYSPFGAVTATGATSTNPYQYTGRETEENGLQYNRARYYNSSTGQFISQDPLSQAVIVPRPTLPPSLQTDNLQMISGLSNQYLYAEDDPTNAMDRSGLDCSTEEGEEEEERERLRRNESVGACGPHPKVSVLGCEYGGVPHPSPGSGSGIGGPGGSTGASPGGPGASGGSGPAGPGTSPKAQMELAKCIHERIGIPGEAGDLAGGG